MAVNRPLGDARLPGDLRRRRVVVAARSEQLEGGSDQSLPRQFGCGHGCESTSFPAVSSPINYFGGVVAMRMLVLGAGLQGSACAYDLLQRPEVERVTLADLHPRRIPAFLEKKKHKRLLTARLDAKRGPQLRKLMRGHDAVMNALPYYFNFPVAKAAVAMGLHCADLGGNTEIVKRQKTLHAAAAKRRVSVIPDCGLAPGMVNIIAAEGIRRVGEADRVKIFVGGLPQQPEQPLNYHI